MLARFMTSVHLSVSWARNLANSSGVLLRAVEPSADWQEWRKLVAHTFEGPPVVEHVREVLKAF